MNRWNRRFFHKTAMPMHRTILLPLLAWRYEAELDCRFQHLAILNELPRTVGLGPLAGSTRAAVPVGDDAFNPIGVDGRADVLRAVRFKQQAGAGVGIRAWPS